MVAATVMAYLIQNVVLHQAETEFQNQVQVTQEVIERRILSYVDLVRGVTGLFAASQTIDRNAFAAYLAQLQIDQYYPGISGISFTRYVSSSERTAYIEGMKAEGYPDFTIRPEGERDAYYVVTYTEPFNPTGGAFGFDLGTSPERLEAIVRARDTGLPAVSQPVSLLNTTSIGFIVFMPIYQNGQSIDTIEQRRANFIGVINAVVTVDQMFQSWVDVFADQQMDVQVYDQNHNAEQILFQTNQGSAVSGQTIHQVRTLDIGGRTWTIDYSADRYYDVTVIDVWLEVTIVALFYLFSIFSFILTYFAMNSQARAQALAQELVIKQKLHQKA
jgi:CHASE1-domain containing sensor protein